MYLSCGFGQTSHLDSNVLSTDRAADRLCPDLVHILNIFFRHLTKQDGTKAQDRLGNCQEQKQINNFLVYSSV